MSPDEKINRLEHKIAVLEHRIASILDKLEVFEKKIDDANNKNLNVEELLD